VNRGDAKAIDTVGADKRIVAEYEFPYLAHAPMEPLNITLRNDGDRAEAWTTSQVPDTQRQAMAEVLGLPADRITYHIGFAGGAFGRRGTLDEHLEREVAAIARRMRGVPIKLIWTREDDVPGGYYRPMVAHRVEVGVGDDGMPSAWRHVVVGQGIVLGTPFESFYAKDGIEALLIEGTNATRIPRRVHGRIRDESPAAGCRADRARADPNANPMGTALAAISGQEGG